jgi:hypothetical protein
MGRPFLLGVQKLPGRGMSSLIEIHEERLVCTTSSEHLADWRPSTPDQVHQLCDEVPGAAASQSAIGSGSVPDLR